MACPYSVIPWVMRRCYGVSLQPVRLKRFDEEEEFGGNCVIQIRGVGDRAVTVAAACDDGQYLFVKGCAVGAERMDVSLKLWCHAETS